MIYAQTLEEMAEEVAQEEPINIAKTFFLAILTGIGLGIGLYIVRRKLQ